MPSHGGHMGNESGRTTWEWTALDARTNDNNTLTTLAIGVENINGV